MSTQSTAACLPIDNDLSIETTTTIVTVNIVALVGVISIFGIACNVMNIVVFCKQGFSETINISYTALAISDLLSLMTCLCSSIFWNPLFLSSGLPIVFFEMQGVYIILPYTCFSTITGFVTAFTTFERWMCVIWPFKVKRILTSTVTVIFIISIYLMICLTMAPVYSLSNPGWRSEPWTNRTLLGVIMSEDAKIMSTISYTFYSETQLFAFIAVSVSTVALIVCLRRNADWRTQQTSVQYAVKKITKRQGKAIKMVALIAAIYMCVQLPTIITPAVTVLCSDFGPKGGYKNIFFAFWSFRMLCGVLNSSVNFLIYYVMSSKFRQTCNQMLPKLFTSKFFCF